MGDGLPELPDVAFEKEDTGDDARFYAPPRLVTHIDDRATAALTAFYRGVLPTVGGTVLDLMSSWVSHLPPEMHFASVIGHGMNSAELAANPRLTRSFVQNLNREPTLPLAAESIDAVLCCVGVQYLQRPIAVLQDARRVLRANAPILISFSNRCFPTKAVAIWRALDARGHEALVRLYLERAGFAAVNSSILADGRDGDPLVVVMGRKPLTL